MSPRPGQPSEVWWEEQGGGDIRRVHLSGTCDPSCEGTLEVPSNLRGSLYVEGDIWGNCSFENIILSPGKYYLRVGWNETDSGEYYSLHCTGEGIGTDEDNR